MRNKRGAELTIGTIIIIILALVVLVFLITGFSMGWKNLWHSILGFGGGSVNVDSVVQSCQIACSTNQEYNYCIKEREVVFTQEQKQPVTTTCKLLEDETRVDLSCPAIDCQNIGTKEQIKKQLKTACNTLITSEQCLNTAGCVYKGSSFSSCITCYDLTDKSECIADTDGVRGRCKFNDNDGCIPKRS